MKIEVCGENAWFSNIDENKNENIIICHTDFIFALILGILSMSLHILGWRGM